MPRLILNPGTEDAQTFDLQPGAHEIGRRPDNTICIPDGSVSGLHCKIIVDENGSTLTDLNSTNGTFVDGQQVNEARLRPGQSLRFGNANVQFQEDEPATEEPHDPHAPRVRLRISSAPQAPDTNPAPAVQKSASAQIVGARPAQASSANCKYHPRNSARWSCPKCGIAFCDMCVSTRATPRGTAHICRQCAVECIPLKVNLQRARKPGFFKVMWGAFIYPVSKGGLLPLIVGSLMFALMSVLSHFSWWITILFYGYFFSYLQNVIHATAMGESQVDWPTPTDFMSEIIVPVFQLFVCALVSFGPAIGLFIWSAANGESAAFFGAIAAVVYGCLYFPMAFLAVAMFDSIAGVNPVLVLPSIGRVFGKYLIACVVLAIVFGVSKSISIGLAMVIQIPFVPDAIASMFGLYFLLVECRMLGLLYWTNSKQLGWFERSR